MSSHMLWSDKHRTLSAACPAWFVAVLASSPHHVGHIRYYITRHSLHSLNDVGLIRFRGARTSSAHAVHHLGRTRMLRACDVGTASSEATRGFCRARADDVYMEVKRKAKDAILAAIESERDGEQIDRSLLKNVLGIFIEARAPPENPPDSCG